MSGIRVNKQLFNYSCLGITGAGLTHFLLAQRRPNSPAYGHSIMVDGVEV